MELAEKIKKLRKDRGLTQEQFAQQLFVSRTAVSKWETGRGIPSMESLQMIAKLYGVTLDELLKAEDVITIAEQENKENLNRFACFMDGIFNIAAVLGLVLPLYKLQQDDFFHSVALYRIDGWLGALYSLLLVTMVLCGIMELAIYKKELQKLQTGLTIAGGVLNVAVIILFILSGQPYPGVMFFALLLIKGAAGLQKRK